MLELSIVASLPCSLSEPKDLSQSDILVEFNCNEGPSSWKGNCRRTPPLSFESFSKLVPKRLDEVRNKVLPDDAVWLSADRKEGDLRGHSSPIRAPTASECFRGDDKRLSGQSLDSKRTTIPNLGIQSVTVEK